MTTITLRFPKGDVEVPIKKVIKLHDIKCALHRTMLFTGPNAGWTVSEISTGMAVGYGATMSEAIKDAGLRAEKYNAAAWKKAIKLAVFGLKKRDANISRVKTAEARLAAEGVKTEGETDTAGEYRVTFLSENGTRCTLPNQGVLTAEAAAKIAAANNEECPSAECRVERV